MKLRFLGTRGEIEGETVGIPGTARSRLRYRSRELIVDCGLDCSASLRALRPQAIVLTHAHPDHAGGLRLQLR